MELSYNELREKEVISVREGKSLGKVSDLVFVIPTGSLRESSFPGGSAGIPLSLPPIFLSIGIGSKRSAGTSSSSI